jgi:hypothetical protein
MATSYSERMIPARPGRIATDAIPSPGKTEGEFRMDQCRNCGAALAPDDDACPRCGATDAAQPESGTLAGRPAPDPVLRMDTRLLALIIIGLTLVSSTIIVIVLSRP